MTRFFVLMKETPAELTVNIQNKINIKVKNKRTGIKRTIISLTNIITDPFSKKANRERDNNSLLKARRVFFQERKQRTSPHSALFCPHYQGKKRLKSVKGKKKKLRKKKAN